MSRTPTDPLPDDWNDREYALGHRLLKQNPKLVTDRHLAMFVLADGGDFAEEAAKARSIGLPPGQDDDACLAKTGSRPATVAMLLSAVQTVANSFRTLRVSRRLLALEEKVEALDARPSGGVKYAGVFEPNHTYTEGSLVTRSGSLWLAVESTDRVPGHGASGWKLVVKSGTVI